MRKIDLEAEKNFENKKINFKNTRIRQEKYYWATQLSIDSHEELTFRKINNKRVLEIGCSNGNSAIRYTKFSSYYCGIDISDQAINKAKLLNLKNSDFLCMDGHNIKLKDEEFDCVIVNSLLHHLDLAKLLPEIYRLLDSEGLLIFREPLGLNPIFNFYRWITPYARTDDEIPLSLADINLLRKYFVITNIQWFGFFTIISAFLKFKLLRKILTSLDMFLSKTPLKFLFWQISGIGKKIV